MNRFDMLYSGNLGLAHEFDTVMEATRRLSSDAKVLFSFVGAGPRFGEVQKKHDGRTATNVAVRDPVRREQLQDVLIAGDVHLISVHPRAVGLVVPWKLVGSLAAGRPTIYVGPAEGEVLTSARCGTRFANADMEGLIAAIQRYKMDVATRLAEGVRVREVFEAKFTKRQDIEQFRGIVESL